MPDNNTSPMPTLAASVHASVHESKLCCSGALPVPGSDAETVDEIPAHAATSQPNPAASGNQLDIAVRRSHDQAKTPFGLQFQANHSNGASMSISISATSCTELRVHLRGGAGGPSRTRDNMRTYQSTRYSAASTNKTFDSYRDVVTYARERKCPQCNAMYISSAQDIENLFSGWQSRGAVTSYLKCRKCSTTACIGCGAKANSARPANTYKADGYQLIWCCGRGRTFLIWVVLCGFDWQFCAEKQHKTSRKGTSGIRGGTKGGGTGYSDYEFLDSLRTLTTENRPESMAMSAKMRA
ncbi:hypothetical protein B0J11DRAFT_579540 [Dendryphion nanum]|uniref:Uncharacterized protein n=1 Tax=Dendryphion nanum TaxID=256645 RepID=A0A9P9ILT9_9PLEO|nr:hypothetical protein B0J11DRAFT_579540 [Dendryphion nanum]